MAQIRPPIIVDEGGSITLYQDVESAAADLEPIDVLNNEYEFFDGAGNRLRGFVEGDRVVIVGALPEQSAPALLEDRLRRFVQGVGADRIGIDRPLDDLGLGDLVEALGDFFGLTNMP